MTLELPHFIYFFANLMFPNTVLDHLFRRQMQTSVEQNLGSL